MRRADALCLYADLSHGPTHGRRGRSRTAAHTWPRAGTKSAPASDGSASLNFLPYSRPVSDSPASRSSLGTSRPVPAPHVAQKRGGGSYLRMGTPCVQTAGTQTATAQKHHCQQNVGCRHGAGKCWLPACCWQPHTTNTCACMSLQAHCWQWHKRAIAGFCWLLACCRQPILGSNSVTASTNDIWTQKHG